jgi:hypothetical protein
VYSPFGFELEFITNAQTYLHVESNRQRLFGLAANWSPSRDTPAANDILVFNNSATTTVTDVPNKP